RLDNCTNAINLANDKLGIPIVVRPEDFCSPHLDDLSGMTYLSYFMNVDSPGYFATRREIRALLQGQAPIENFTTDWNDGQLLCTLVKCVGGDVVGWPSMHTDSERNLQNGVDGARALGIEPIFSAKEMSDPEVEHLGIMAYAAYFRKYKPVRIVAAKPTLSGNFDDVYVRQEKHFAVNAAGSLPSSIRAEVVGPSSTVPVDCDWTDDRCECRFTPSETGQHKLNIFCDDEPIPGCPVPFRVNSDRSKIRHDPLDKAIVGINSEMKVDTLSAGQGEIRIEATSPSGRVHTLPVMYHNEGEHAGNFIPNEVGEWTMTILYDGENIQGSPYPVRVFDPSLVRITDLQGGKVGHGITFGADASYAGEGEVTCQVIHDGETVPCYLTRGADNKYNVDFTPRAPGTYEVRAFLNDIEVKGSPYTVDILDSSRVTVTGHGLSLVPVNTPAIFTVHTNGAGGGKVDVDISGPSQENVPCNLSSESNGDTVVTYIPTDVGDYTIRVQYGHHDVTDSPFVAKAYNTGAIKVTPLADGLVNETMFFTIDVGEAGEGQLQIMVNNGNIPNEVEAQRPGLYLIKFVPVDAGMQQVDIQFNDHNLPCSPLTCMAQALNASIVGLTGLVPVQTESSFRIQSQANIAKLSTDVQITAPNGENINARLVQQADGDYKVEWTPQVPGRHSIQVLFGGQQVSGSPFYIDVFDIHKIRVNNFHNGNVNETAGFKVDCTQAGQGNQEIRIESPSGRDVHHEVVENPPLEYHVTYTPTERGQHRIYISYSGMQLNGSPFHQEISEGALPSAHGDGLHKGEEDKPATFIIDARGMKGEPSVQVDGPNAIAKCSIDPMPDGQFKVTYIPVEVGLFSIHVKWNGKEIPGSPFYPKVVDSRKVKVVGGWQHYMDGSERIHLVVGEEKRIPFDTSEAGPGQLRAEVKSPSSFLPVQVDDEHKGKSTVVFTPSEEGTHYLNLYWSDHPLVNSPYIGYATSGVADPSKVWLTGHGLKEATIRQEAEFYIDGSQAGP
ncbi:hypothetical protein EGW08_016447, partial [Elysia chlorotica]